MYKTILVALALDQGHAPRAFELARRLKDEGGKIVAVHVIDKVPNFARLYMSPENDEKIEQRARQAILDRIGEQGDAEAVVLSGHPGRTVTDYAREIGADCIIAGSHTPNVNDFFLGSTAARIMRYATCSVHILR
jgi:nucleotide-binding universal stress UspA family protein